LQEFYGEKVARAIFGGTATKFIFNPQDGESAKIFADYLGEEEVLFNSNLSLPALKVALVKALMNNVKNAIF
jgi:type IV secretory pathway TraG/TraD family ATPase VirD4